MFKLNIFRCQVTWKCFHAVHTEGTLLWKSDRKENLNLPKNWLLWLLYFRDSFIFGAEIGFRYCSRAIVKEDHSEVVRWRGMNRRCQCSCFFFEQQSSQYEANNLLHLAILVYEKKNGPELLKWKPLIMVSFVCNAEKISRTRCVYCKWFSLLHWKESHHFLRWYKHYGFYPSRAATTHFTWVAHCIVKVEFLESKSRSESTTHGLFCISERRCIVWGNKMDLTIWTVGLCSEGN